MVEILVRMVAREVGDSAEKARVAVGEEMLYGALVLERSWMSGGCARAMPRLDDWDSQVAFGL
jgi:hypothetical protein